MKYRVRIDESIVAIYDLDTDDPYAARIKAEEWFNKDLVFTNTNRLPTDFYVTSRSTWATDITNEKEEPKPHHR